MSHTCLIATDWWNALSHQYRLVTTGSRDRIRLSSLVSHRPAGEDRKFVQCFAVDFLLPLVSDGWNE